MSNPEIEKAAVNILKETIDLIQSRISKAALADPEQAKTQPQINEQTLTVDPNTPEFRELEIKAFNKLTTRIISSLLIFNRDHVYFTDRGQYMADKENEGCFVLASRTLKELIQQIKKDNINYQWITLEELRQILPDEEFYKGVDFKNKKVVAFLLCPLTEEYKQKGFNYGQVISYRRVVIPDITDKSDKSEEKSSEEKQDNESITASST